MVALGALSALSLRPVSVVEEAVEHLLAPVRLIAEVELG